jgi:hypothetical protein
MYIEERAKAMSSTVLQEFTFKNDLGEDTNFALPYSSDHLSTGLYEREHRVERL